MGLAIRISLMWNVAAGVAYSFWMRKGLIVLAFVRGNGIDGTKGRRGLAFIRGSGGRREASLSGVAEIGLVGAGDVSAGSIVARVRKRVIVLLL